VVWATDPAPLLGFCSLRGCFEDSVLGRKLLAVPLELLLIKSLSLMSATQLCLLLLQNNSVSPSESLRASEKHRSSTDYSIDSKKRKAEEKDSMSRYVSYGGVPQGPGLGAAWGCACRVQPWSAGGGGRLGLGRILARLSLCPGGAVGDSGAVGGSAPWGQPRGLQLCRAVTSRCLSGQRW